MTPGFRILLIDDDEVDRARVLRALRPEHEVCQAATAAKGKACIETGFDGHAPDVVLLDLRLPDADGFVRWLVELDPMGREAIRLRYTLRRHGDVVGI